MATNPCASPAKLPDSTIDDGSSLGRPMAETEPQRHVMIDGIPSFQDHCAKIPDKTPRESDKTRHELEPLDVLIEELPRRLGGGAPEDPEPGPVE